MERASFVWHIQAVAPWHPNRIYIIVLPSKATSQWQPIKGPRHHCLSTAHIAINKLSNFQQVRPARRVMFQPQTLFKLLQSVAAQHNPLPTEPIAAFVNSSDRFLANLFFDGDWLGADHYKKRLVECALKALPPTRARRLPPSFGCACD